MTEDERNRLVAVVLSDTKATLMVRKAKVKVAGPWVSAISTERRVSVHRGLWRLNAKGEEVATVHPFWKHCDSVYEPEPTDFSLGEEAEYEEAMAGWRAKVALQKAWVYHLRGDSIRYADTEEEAKALADADLRAKGYLLADS